MEIFRPHCIRLMLMSPTPAPHNQPLSDWQQRFGGLTRLYGQQSESALRTARVLIVGVGGVGTWVAEALARSGIACLGLMDADDVCITNTNRQLHAITGTIGKPKTQAMAERVHAIYPHLHTEEFPEFFGSKTTAVVTEGGWNVVVDAIDAVPAKCLLLATCHAAGIPVVTCGGAGGKRDGTQVRAADLACTVNDPLLKQVRKILRRDYQFPREPNTRFGIHAIFSAENPVFPWADGSVCPSSEPGSSLKLDCASGFGTAAHVTGAFGLAAASAALAILLQ